MNVRMVNQGVKLPIGLKDMLESEAAQLDITSSALVRIIIEKYFNAGGSSKDDLTFREAIADALKIILATRGRGPMSSDMASSLVDEVYLGKESECAQAQ